MNNKILSIKSSAIFLALVLVTGTIAAFAPSFMVGAQAIPEYGMEREYDSYEPEYTDRNNYESTEYPSYNQEYPSDNNYKSKDSSSTIIKKVKCNNINSNNNFVDVNAGIPTDDALVDAQGADNEGQAITANGEGYNNGYKQNSNDFKFVCINNNNNEVVVINETTPIPLPPPDTITCEECFEENLTPEQLAGLNSFLEGRQPVPVDGFDIEIAINDLAAYCTLISLASTEESLSETVRSILFALNERVLPPEDAIPEPIIEEIIQCVLEALANEV